MTSIAALVLTLACWTSSALAQTTYTWNVPGSGAWTTASNWTPTRTTPATNDVLLFDGSSTAAPTVTGVPTQTIGQLSVTNACQLTLNSAAAVNVTLSGGTGTDLTVGAGALLALSATASGNAISLTLPAATTGSVLGSMTSGATTGSAAHRVLPTDAGSLVFGAGSMCRAALGHTGNLFGATGTNAAVVFQTGALYRQFAGANPFGNAGVNRSVFQAGSTYRQESNLGFSLSARTYANLEVDWAPLNLSLVGSPGSPVTMDNLTMVSGLLLFSHSSGAFVLNLRGNLAVAAGASLGFDSAPSVTSLLAMVGTTPQTISVAPTGTLTFNLRNTIQVANAAGATLLSDVTTDGAVNLSAGNLNTGLNTLRLSATGSIIPGAQWVNGNLARDIPGSAIYDFPVGDAASAAGLNLLIGGVTSPGTLVASTTAGDAPSLIGSGLLASRSVNRTWSLAPSPAPTFVGASVTLNYPSGELDGGVTPASLAVGKRDGTLWTRPAHGIGTSTSITTSGLTSFSTFAVAEVAPDHIAAVPSGCISTATPCLAVPVVWTRTDATPARATSVTVELSANLTLCGAQATDGGYLVPGAGGVSLFVLPLGGNQYTVDLSTLGLPCGATGNGTLFNLLVSSASPGGSGTITVTEALARDCNNTPIPAAPGLTAIVPIDQVVPAAITIAAAQKKIGNIQPPDGTTDIQLTWGAPEAGTTVAVYRKGFGGYPQYDENGGLAPLAPATPAAALLAGWTLSSVTTTGGFDRTGARDFQYFVGFVTDGCGNVSPVSNRTNGTLNYHLGDVHNGLADCTGNDLVNTSDMSFLGANYGTLVAVNGPLECLDVGPTTDFSVDARPTTDNRVQFEDLIVFAINHGQVSAPEGRQAPAAAARNDLRLAVPALPATGETFAVSLEMSGAGGIQGFTSRLDYDRAVVEFVGAEPGALLARQTSPGVALSAEAGTVDVALLGEGAGILGEGEIARVIFRVKSAGDAGITLQSAEGRDAANRSLSLGMPLASTAQLPRMDALSRAMPTPFRDRTTLEFALARAGRAELAIYTVQGRRVRMFAGGEHAAGVHRVAWDGRDDDGRLVPAGVYFVRLTTPQVRQSTTLIRVR